MTDPANPGSPGPIDPGHALTEADRHRHLQLLRETAAPRAREDDEDVIDLREYWRILVRRRWTILTTLAVAVVIAILATFLTTPIYRATLLMQIDRESGKVIEYQGITPEETVNAKDFYQTQYELLKSNTLARRVIDQLGLQTSATLTASQDPSLVGSILERIKGTDAPAEAPDGTRNDAAVEDLFLENLTVAPVKNSRLVKIHYDSPNPEEAARIANAVAENFVNTTLERRFDASAYAKTFLEERTQQVRANLEDSERRLVAYAREREIVNLDDRLEILIERLKEMNKELIAVEAARIEAEAIYRTMTEGADEGAFIGVLDSPVIQALKARKQELENEYEENLKVFKPAYPTMQQLQRQIAEVNQEITQEVAAIRSATGNQYNARVDQEAKLKARVATIKDEILALQDRSTDFQTLKREVETNRELYDGLLQRMKEIGVVAGIGTNNISIVDPARVPHQRYKPSLSKNLAIAIALGLFGGILLAFLFETLDETIKSSEDFEQHLHLPVLSVIPDVVASGEASADEITTLAFRAPSSTLAEAYRSLRTALFFSSTEGAPKILHFTSGGPGEGKTTTAVAVAASFAQNGASVLLIDADLRNPSLHDVFDLPDNQVGLSNYLANDAKPSAITKATEIPKLFLIPSGPIPPQPVDLLSSAKMLDLLTVAGNRFDYVILDSPPVLGLADAPVIANLANATIFIAAAGTSRISAIDGSIKRLRSAGVHILGGVLTKFGHGRSSHGYGYDYHYNYHYSYGDKPTALQKTGTA